MVMEAVADRGLVLLGCGKMGSALLSGWLEGGLPAAEVWVVDPAPSDWVLAQGVHVNAPLPESPAIALVAVKPQMMGEALPALKALGGGGTLFVSIAAGTPISTFEAALGTGTPIVRAMPNTPAAIRRGITALVGNAACGEDDLALAESLLAAVGQTVRLEDESQMDAVTAGSGSGLSVAKAAASLTIFLISLSIAFSASSPACLPLSSRSRTWSIGSFSSRTFCTSSRVRYLAGSDMEWPR